MIFTFSMMTSTLKTIVSKKKKRYQANGFDLDLSYILPNLIAMGFPAERLERVFRNNIEDVVKFMEAKHKDHYFIYNLCSERSYDHSKFHNRVSVFPIDDHNPPPFELIKPFCQDVYRWLKQDSRNVAAIHCKAGKGRTGVMVCAYILHTNKDMDADSALNLYAEKRTHNRRGVTIPSQRRYVHYYERLVKSGLDYMKIPLYIRCIRMDPMPLSLKTNLVPSVVIWEGKEIVFKGCLVWRRWQDTGIYTEFHSPVRLNGDIKVEVYNGKIDFSANHNKVKGDRMFTFWFNTFFVKLESSSSTSSTLPSSISSSTLLSPTSNNLTTTTLTQHQHQQSPPSAPLVNQTQQQQQQPLATTTILDNIKSTFNPLNHFMSKPVPIPLSTDSSNTFGNPGVVTSVSSLVVVTNNNNGKIPGKFKVTSSSPSSPSSSSTNTTSSHRLRSRSTTNSYVMMLNNSENSTPHDENNKSSSASSHHHHNHHILHHHINSNGTICISPSSNLTSNYNCVTTIPKVNGISFKSISDQSSSLPLQQSQNHQQQNQHQNQLQLPTQTQAQQSQQQIQQQQQQQQPTANKGKPLIYNNSSSSFNSSSIIDPRKNSLSGSNKSELTLQEEFTLNLKKEDLDKLSKSTNPDFQVSIKFSM
ncbi:phosphatidylinositol 3,4,5-trisphosphate 3-phosphatase and dual-specificity protein phosphatase PTEN-like [Panonychus citri]|uniref:phosphatidylinositol 3,4,5-trisphosphate 3-phosphatase and dual-specificity protein phosphatase PTEN-like n=1 Tax=Panonychus citri TaxID=50023 RepID=UPI0023073CFB|nr:phosphatidylinositol 3,4,5-trisphosphate 3-phosphatase and dual-specificity protein phosphatase PTEN-like [Panonychus citri]